MRAIILQGNETLKTEFVNDFINKGNIPAYNVHRFDEELKIAEAREIKRILSRSALSGRDRLIIVAKASTVEAQNALLKTIEELPDDTSIIFLHSQDLLPTIFSRCTVKTLGVAESLEKPSALPSYFDPGKSITAAEALLIADQLLESKSNSIEEVILSLRRELLLGATDLDKTKFLHKLFVNLNEYYSLVTTNNLSARLVIEKSLIKTANEMG